MSISPYGLIELPWWGYPLVTFATIQTMFLGVTLYQLREWCSGAEGSGIGALREFAQRLPAYAH